jgi:hypothetical protein
LLKKNTTFVWNDADKHDFDNLKLAFTGSLVFSNSESTRPYIVETDASDYTLAAIISHYDASKILRSDAFHSQQLLQAERNYGVYDKNFWQSLKLFRYIMQGSIHQVIVLCDRRILIILWHPVPSVLTTTENGHDTPNSLR